MALRPRLARSGDTLHTIRAPALSPPIGDCCRLSTPLYHRCPRNWVPLPELCRVPAPHLLQDMSLNRNRRGRRKAMLGVLQHRVELSFRTTAMTVECLFQCLLSPTRFMGNQWTHHPHTRNRETDKSEATFYILSSYIIPTQKSLRDSRWQRQGGSRI